MNCNKHELTAACAPSLRTESAFVQFVAVALYLGASVTVGCSHAVYTATSLPPELAAPVAVHSHEIDLSGLAGPAVRHDVIQAGDLLDVTIVTGLEEDLPAAWLLRISDQGTLNVPLVGLIFVAGMQLTEAEMVIRNESVRRGVYRNPNVSVVLNERKSNRVTVVGAVPNPGTYDLPTASSDLLAALVAAGGLKENAESTVRVRSPPRGDGGTTEQQGSLAKLTSYDGGGLAPESRGIVQVDLTQTNPHGSRAVYLENGSVVHVPSRPPRMVHVIGLVRNPNQFEVPPHHDLRLLDALALAGGRSMQVANKVHVVRRKPGSDDLVTIRTFVRQAKQDGKANIRLAPGDVVSVEETPLTFIIDTVRSFIRFGVGFSSGIPGI